MAKSGHPWMEVAGNRWLPVFFILLMVAACSRPPPEQQLREAIGEIEAAIEERDVSGLRSWLADDFIGPDGMDREAAARLARVMFMRHRDVGATVAIREVDTPGDHATVRLEAVLTGGAGRALPDAARVYTVRTGWRYESGEWRMTSAEWSPRL